MEDDGYVLVPREDETPIPTLAQYQSPPEYLSEISTTIDALADPLWPLNTFIHANPELAYQEHKAHDALTSFLRTQPGWAVTPSAHAIPTAWIATFSASPKPGPTVSFNIEMDALPNLGHACGHNLIATASLAAGLATATVLKTHNLPGRVTLLGTPGEEGYRGGKILLLERGAYDNVDISLISHPGILHNSPMVRTPAFCRLKAAYHGHAAHAAKNPWEGINALDAVIVAYNAIAALRQQTMPDDIISVSIDGGGETTNIIHEFASCVVVLRARTASRLDQLIERVKGCLKAGAEATGARVGVDLTMGYQDHVPNALLAGAYRRYWTALPDVPEPKLPRDGETTFVMSSTDQGNLSHKLPSVNASFAIPPGPAGGQPHSADFEVAAGTREAFDAALRVGKALAGTAVDVVTREGFLGEVRRRWREDLEGAMGG
ncbi:hypothetical protein OQA88_8588 [Cercophora sp. LCS_1]